MKRTVFETKEAWLEWRKDFRISATDAASICGADKYRSRYALWAEKLGMVERSEMPEAAEWGILLEDIVRRKYAEVTGQKVRKYAPWTTFTSDSLEWMVGTPDGRIAGDGVYEGKTCSLMLRGEWQDGPPNKYMFQIQHMMAVMDYTWCGIACLVGGQELVHHEVNANSTFQQNLIAEEFAFLGLLRNRIPPAVDGSDSTAAALAQVFKKPEPTKIDLPDEFLALYTDRQNQVESANTSQTRVQEIDNLIKSFMGNNEEAYLPSGEKFTWKPNKNGVRVFRAPKA